MAPDFRKPFFIALLLSLLSLLLLLLLLSPVSFTIQLTLHGCDETGMGWRIEMRFPVGISNAEI